VCAKSSITGLGGSLRNVDEALRGHSIESAAKSFPDMSSEIKWAACGRIRHCKSSSRTTP